MRTLTVFRQWLGLRTGQTPGSRWGQTPSSQGGQTVVEYILLCSLIAAGILIFQSVFSDSMKEVLAGQSVTAQQDASWGGKKSVHDYYVEAEAKTTP